MRTALILRSGPKGRVSKDGVASCFETPHFVRLLSMRLSNIGLGGCSRIMIFI